MSNEFYDGVVQSALVQEISSIGAQERNGVLEVTGAETVTRLHFRKGALVDAQRVAGSDLWPLGDYLTYGGILSPREVFKALETAARKNMQVEEVLITYEAVTDDLLTRFVGLQLEESLFPLFYLDTPLLAWFDERPKASRFCTPLPVEWIVKESRRRSDLWARLEESVGKKTAIFDKDGSNLAELLGYTHDREEPLPSIGGNARIVFFFINGEKNVVQVARASGLGLFQVYQALYELIDVDVVELVSLSGEGERPATMRPYVRHIVLALTYAIFVFVLGLGVRWGINHGDDLQRHFLSHYVQDSRAEQATELQRLKSAMELHELEFGHYPTSVAELAEVGYALGDEEHLKRTYRLEFDSVGYKLVRDGEKE